MTHIVLDFAGKMACPQNQEQYDTHPKKASSDSSRIFIELEHNIYVYFSTSSIQFYR